MSPRSCFFNNYQAREMRQTKCQTDPITTKLNVPLPSMWLPTFSKRSISSCSPASDGVVVFSFPSPSRSGHIRSFCGPVEIMLHTSTKHLSDTLLSFRIYTSCLITIKCSRSYLKGTNNRKVEPPIASTFLGEDASHIVNTS